MKVKETSDQHPNHHNTNTNNQDNEIIPQGKITITNYVFNLGHLLAIPPDSRTPLILQRIAQCLKFLKFFDDMEQLDPNNNHSSRKGSCKYLQFRKYKKGSMILKYKSKAEYFYINLKGKIGAFAPLPASKVYQSKTEVNMIRNRDEFQNREDITFEDISRLCNKFKADSPIYESLMKFMSISKKGVIYSDGYLRILTGGLSKNEIDPKSKMFDPIRYNLFMYDFVATIEPGKMFGELGLVFNRPRAATIVALEDVEVAYLNKSHFLEVFGDILRQEQLEKLKFFNDIVIKSEEQKYLANTLMIMFRREYFKKGDILIKEGTRMKKLIVIYSGEVALCKYSDKDQSTLPNMATQGKGDYSEISKIFMSKSHKKYQSTLAVLCKGEMVGEEYLIKPRLNKVLEYSVIAHTSGILYTLERSKLDQVFDTNEEIKELFLEKIDLKLDLLKKMKVVMEDQHSFNSKYKKELANLTLKKSGLNMFGSMTSCSNAQQKKIKMLKSLSQRNNFSKSSRKIKMSSSFITNHSNSKNNTPKSSKSKNIIKRDLSMDIIQLIRMQDKNERKREQRKLRIKNSLRQRSLGSEKEFRIQDVVSSRMGSLAHKIGLNSPKNTKKSEDRVIPVYDRTGFMTKPIFQIFNGEVRPLPKILIRKGIQTSIFGSSKAFYRKRWQNESLNLKTVKTNTIFSVNKSPSNLNSTHDKKSSNILKSNTGDSVNSSTNVIKKKRRENIQIKNRIYDFESLNVKHLRFTIPSNF